MDGVLTKFVSQKISKIRWQTISRHAVQQSDVFTTGSWDNVAENRVSIWTVRPPPELSNEEGLIPAPEGDAQLLCEAYHTGDVTDLQFVTGEHIAATSSSGSLSLYRYHPRTQTLAVSHTWNKIHHHGERGAPCTGVAMKNDDTLVTVGEDGRIVMLNIEQRQPLQVIDDADSCTLHAVTFLRQFEVATINSIGQMKVWDIRQPEHRPASILQLAGERTALHCIDKHPTQPHIVATGGQEGVLCIWDMRQDKFPVTLLSAHESTMWEVKFHPTHPDNLFTCSDDGSAWHWDGSKMTAQSSTSLPQKANSSMLSGLGGSSKPVASHTSPWLSCEASKHRLEIVNLLSDNLMPVNSLDITGTTLLAGTDGEQIYTVKNIPIV